MELRGKNPAVIIKRSFQRAFLHYGHTSKYVQLKGQPAADLMKEQLMDKVPRMICRFGSNELQTVAGVLRESRLLHQFDWYERFHWGDLMDNLCNMAGFFPKEVNQVRSFGHQMIQDMKEVDILGSWRSEEHYVSSHLASAVRIRLKDLEPYTSQDPWTEALAAKRVLVIHPFEETIQQQYKKREVLFKDSRMLPNFELKTIKAVQSIAGNETPFESWFDALNYMKRQIEEVDFDIALIGCGAYGFPLAAHVKRMGKKAVHVGGALQLMFGIMGKRWESNERIRLLKNEHWVYPSSGESPKNKESVEGGCYW